jgi:hypothetical protein
MGRFRASQPVREVPGSSIGLRIACGAGAPLPGPEVADAADFGLVAAIERVHHSVEYALHYNGSFLSKNLHLPRQFPTKFAFVRIAELAAEFVVLTTGSPSPFVSMPDPNPADLDQRSYLSAGEVSSARVEMVHTWPDGSIIRPLRWPRNRFFAGSRTLAHAATARSITATDYTSNNYLQVL